MALKFGTSGLRGLNTEFSMQIVRAYVEAFIEHARVILKSAVPQCTEVTRLRQHEQVLDPINSLPALESIALAGDLRESTPGIIAMIKEVFESHQIAVQYCGFLPTPALALYCAEAGVPGIMVTGSHIPADRNGIKFYWPWGEILKSDEIAILTIYQRIADQFKVANGFDLDSAPENQTALKAQTNYIRRYTEFFSPYRQFFSGKKVVVYQHSAVARDLWKPILSELGFHVVEVGRSSIFTPVDTETDEAIVQLKAIYDFSAHSEIFAVVSSDGDADRPFLCDENLNMVRGDTLGILSAQFLNANCVVTPVSSNTALEKLDVFSKIVRTQIGSPYVIEAMDRESGAGVVLAEPSTLGLGQRTQVVVGFEANGGLLLGTSVTRKGMTLSPLPTRDSVLPVLCCLALAAEQNLPISELVNTLPRRYTDSGLLRNFPMEKKDQIYTEALRGEAFKKGEIFENIDIVEHNQIDGLRLTFGNSEIIHFRPSGNAPEFRCYAEASSPHRASALVKGGLQWLEEFR